MDKYYQILELESDASWEDIRNSYQDLVQIWHPDKYSNSSQSLQDKANKKLSEINEAYNKLEAFYEGQPNLTINLDGGEFNQLANSDSLLCPKCGKETARNVSVCLKCGGKLIKEELNSPLLSEGGTQEKDNRSSVGCLFFVFLCSAFFYQIWDSKTNSKSSPSPSQRASSFRMAFEGDYWIINDKNIAILRTPNSPSTEAQLKRNRAAGLIPGSKVEIIKREGWLSPWMFVYAYKGEGVYAKGWILAETIKSSRRVKKGINSP